MASEWKKPEDVFLDWGDDDGRIVELVMKDESIVSGGLRIIDVYTETETPVFGVEIGGKGVHLFDAKKFRFS
jgi:hypothetical protein